MKSIYIPVEAGYLFCKTIGKGKPLVLLHGSEENHEIFEKQMAYFSSHYQVIVLDSRGHGRSDHGTGPLTFKQMTQDIVEVLNYLKIKSVSVIGFSDGGNLALYLASHYPEKIDKMILIGANFKADGLKLSAWLQVKWQYSYLNGLGKIFPASRRRKEVIDLMLHQLDLKETDLKKIQAPTLIVAGEFDVIKRQHTNEVHRLIATSQLVIVPKATHFLMVEEYELFNQLADQFLQEPSIR
ncbi:MAG: alpha/beta hydrolase [Carnobacterium sp.]|uniref:alpha/beta fold hydrolase n=1 Tax=Carnobacterium sp. TaxID=48221 RepID=UPI002FCBC4A3